MVGAPKKPARIDEGGFPIFVAFFAIVWGFVFMELVVFFSENHDAILAASQEREQSALIGVGMLGFIAISMVVVLVLTLIGLFSRSRRKKALTCVVFFFAGWAARPTIFALAGA